MSWTLWARSGKPAPPAPSRPPEPRVTVNRVHGYVSFNQAALSLMGLTESRVEFLYDPGHRLAWLPTRGGGPRLCHDQGPPSRGPEASQAGRRKVREVRACPRRCRLGHSMFGTAEGTAGVGEAYRSGAWSTLLPRLYPCRDGKRVENVIPGNASTFPWHVWGQLFRGIKV